MPLNNAETKTKQVKETKEDTAKVVLVIISIKDKSRNTAAKTGSERTGQTFFLVKSFKE